MEAQMATAWNHPNRYNPPAWKPLLISTLAMVVALATAAVLISLAGGVL
jgi:hypothetical protein